MDIRKKVALVDQRYGLEVVGGSETHCRLLAEHLSASFDVEVLSSCALSSKTWANYYPEGWQRVNGIKVLRFPVHQERDQAETDRLVEYLNASPTPLTQMRWELGQGPYCPDLFDYIHDNYATYDAIIFLTYLYYTTAVCMIGIPNAILLPTAHDEMPLKLPYYRRVFASAAALSYNTEEEKTLLEERFPVVKGKPSIIGCYGLEMPEIALSEPCNEEPAYILYAGRIARGKCCDELFDLFARYKEEHPSSLKLILIGQVVDVSIPERSDIEFLGFVSEERKRELMKGARLFVLPSRYESLSIVVLEALAVNTPVLVTAGCAVLQAHVNKSRAGYAYRDYNSFAQAVNEAVALSPAYMEKTCGQGRKYVERYYSWDSVIKKFVDLVDRLGYKSERQEKLIRPAYASTYYCRLLEPAFPEEPTAVVLAADDVHAPMLAVVLQSLIDTTAPGQTYDIVVLSDHISSLHKENLLRQLPATAGISLRFLETADSLGKKWHVALGELHLFLPELLPDYSRAVWLDSCVLVRRDIKELCHIEMEGSMLAAVPDLVSTWMEEKGQPWYEPGTPKTREQPVRTEVMIMNLDYMREEMDIESMWEETDIWKSWEKGAGMLLHRLAAGRIKHLDYSWNLYFSSGREMQAALRLDPAYNAAFDQPYIINYAGGMLPTEQQSGWRAEEFWQTARKTWGYEILVRG